MADDRMHCEPICDESGEVIGVARVSDDFSDEARGHLLEVIAAARRLHEQQLAEDPGLAERQVAAMERVRERGRRRRGESQ